MNNLKCAVCGSELGFKSRNIYLEIEESYSDDEFLTMKTCKKCGYVMFFNELKLEQYLKDSEQDK